MAGKKKRPDPIHAREYALEVLMRLAEEQAYSNLALDAVFRKYKANPQDKKLASSIVYGTLEKQFIINQYIRDYTGKRYEKLDLLVKTILQISIWQLYFSAIPDSAAVNEAVKMTQRYGYHSAKAFVNAVLRSILREHTELQAKSQEAKYGFNQDIFLQLKKQLGSEEEVYKFSQSLENNYGIPIRLRGTKDEIENNKRKLTNEYNTSAAFLHSDSIYLKTGGKSIQSVDLWENAEIIAQGEAAMLPAKVLDPRPNEKILDMCAAPGGKTMQLYDLSAGQAQIVAWDIHLHRVELMKNTHGKFQIKGIDYQVQDASIQDKRQFASFDKILLDAPCSALGLLANKAELRSKWSSKQVKEDLLSIQATILDHAALLLKPAGLLLYSTCSLYNEENEKQIQRFLDKHPNFRLQSIMLDNQLKQRLLELDPLLENEMEAGYITLWPHRTMTEGFFLALLKKE